MIFTTSLIMFVLAAPQALWAAPTNEVLDRDLVSRTDGHLFVCTDWNFEGSCKNIGFTSGVCQNFPSAYQNDISSVGPDDGWLCTLFIDYNCNADLGPGYRTIYPGVLELTNGYNDVFNSFVCSSS